MNAQIRQNWNQEALTVLLVELQSMIFPFVKQKIRNEHDAMDVTQEALLRITRNIDRFDESKAKVTTWAITIAKNLCADYYRRKKETHFLDEQEILVPSRQSVEHEVLNNEFRSLLKKALSKMPAHYQRAFMLRHLEQRSYEEIAQALGLPITTVKTHLYRAKQQLKGLLTEFQVA